MSDVARLRVPGLLLLVTLAVFGSAGCSAPEIQDAQKRPDLVTLGMSAARVEALVGKSSESRWKYEQGRVLVVISVRGGRVTGYSRTPIGVPISSPNQIETWSRDYPPFGSRRPPNDYQRVASMTPQEVRNAFGTPPAIDELYLVRGEDYLATFFDGKVVEFRNIPRPATPHH